MPVTSIAMNERGKPARWTADAASHTGLVRRGNEDSYLTAEFESGGRSYAFWAVADGMGGAADGEVASRLAVQTAFDTLTAMTWSETRLALSKAVQAAHEAIAAEAARRAVRMGTTLVVALVDKATAAAWVANVGDSRAYVIEGERLARVTDDHSIVGEQVAAGLLDDAAASQSLNRHVITRALGMRDAPAVDVFGPRQLAPGERLLLCSDGLSGMVDDETIARIASAHPRDAAPRLVQAALEAGGRDNVTVLIGGSGQQARQGLSHHAPPWSRPRSATA